MTSNPPPTVTTRSRQENRVTVVLGDQSGRTFFKLSCGGETVPLTDSGSLNRWAAVGIVERHKITVSTEGVTIDGRQILYSDAHAAADLESILNRSHGVTPKAPGPAAAPGTSHTRPDVTLENEPVRLGDSVHVSRDGFEFHVSYRTRFGENKTEKLETALEIFQNMRAYKPHVNLQKSGIRLVVTRWDGENFIEEHGIENLEHASPEEVEALIRANMPGGAASVATAASRPPSQPHVVRVELVKKSHDARFHLLLHRADGTVQEGPLLIRPNMGKLAAERLFRPDVAVSMTALNDRIIVEQNASGSGKQAETFPLNSVEDAARVQAVFNACLKPAAPLAAAVGLSLPPLQEKPEAPPREEPPAPSCEAAPVVTPVSENEAPPPPALEEFPARMTSPPEQGPLPPAPEAEERPLPEPSLEQRLRRWSEGLFKSVETLQPETLNGEVFTAVRDRFERSVSSNDHGFPAFTIDWTGKGETRMHVEFVLTPHYLLCNLPFGYARFGPETRLFLTRLDDYMAFAQPALRGVVEPASGGGICFVVSEDFAQFLQANQDRSYRTHFSATLRTPAALTPADRLIWPLSREERLFHLAGTTAKSYGLPVAADRVVLDPNAPVFVGFVKAPPHGMEFRDGDDFVRFTPLELEINDEGEVYRFTGTDVLLGWALDRDGRVCALYRKGSGFVPPHPIKLLRFLSEEERSGEGDSLNILAAA